MGIVNNEFLSFISNLRFIFQTTVRERDIAREHLMKIDFKWRMEKWNMA